MKIRKGFVSNSSSTSFVIAKDYLTNKQYDKLKEWYHSFQDSDQSMGDNGWYWEEKECYVGGEIYRVKGDFDDLCEDLGIKPEHVFYHYE